MTDFKLTVNDKEYNLLFGMRFWRTLYKETKISLNDLGSQLTSENVMDQPEASAALIYSGIITYDEKHKTDQGVSPDDAFDMLEYITQENLAAIMKVISESQILGNKINAGLKREGGKK